MTISPDLAPNEPADAIIFVLDGDPGFRRAVAERLLHAGFRAVLFRRASELLKALRALRPSMIVADLVVAEVSGADVLGAIRRDDDVRDIPVVILTDRNDTALPLRLDTPVVYKPDIDGLVAAVQSALRPSATLSNELLHPKGGIA